MKKRQRKKNFRKLLDRMGLRRIRAIKPRIEADIDPAVSALVETHGAND